MLYQTKLLSPFKEEDLCIALELLRAGEVVGLPTETVYGLAGDARNINAVEKIFVAKGRPLNHPLIVHIASYEKLDEWAKNISPLARTLAQNFWPGPLTMLLNKADSVNDVVTGGLATIALRVPRHKVFLDLLERLNSGIAAPSANLYKRVSPTSAKHVMSGLSGKISAVLDAGPCELGLESTIVDLTHSHPRILRPGPITQKMLEEVLHMPVENVVAHSERVSGNMETHYQPYTTTMLMTMQEMEEYLLLPHNEGKRFAVMHYSALGGVMGAEKAITFKRLPETKNEYAQSMYQSLHELDALEVNQILVETPPQDSEWNGILDRLSKGCSKKHQNV